MLTEAQKKRLLVIARQAMESKVGTGRDLSVESRDLSVESRDLSVESRDLSVESRDLSELDAELSRKKGVFVTIKKGSDLRGCIGHILADSPLYQTVADMAAEAAFGDPRFPALLPAELKEIRIEISVLSELEKITEAAKIEVGKHGILIRKHFNSGLLLPQVAAEYGWGREEFLEHTCLKAGLSKHAWRKGAEIYIFSSEVFGE